MDTEKYQKELFEFEFPKKAAPRFGNIFLKTDFVITLTAEKMVFAAIGVIMLMVIFFALGVEKGRSAAYAKFTHAPVREPLTCPAPNGAGASFGFGTVRDSTETKTMTKDIVSAQALLVKSARAPIVVTRGAAATNITPKISPQAATIKTQAVFDKTKPYTVVAAAFSREDLALKEISKLKTAGLEAFLYYGEPYYLACVGSFQSKDGAGKILNKVKQIHRDAYVRLR